MTCTALLRRVRPSGGYPDIIGVYKGRFFALEVKRDKHGVAQRTGRIALQRYVMLMIKRAGGFAEFIYPEIEEEVLSALLSSVEHDLDSLEAPTNYED